MTVASNAFFASDTFVALTGVSESPVVARLDWAVVSFLLFFSFTAKPAVTYNELGVDVLGCFIFLAEIDWFSVSVTGALVAFFFLARGVDFTLLDANFAVRFAAGFFPVADFADGAFAALFLDVAGFFAATLLTFFAADLPAAAAVAATFASTGFFMVFLVNL
jgi:hypothetical protein